jgi:hypothetical protein
LERKRFEKEIQPKVRNTQPKKYIIKLKKKYDIEEIEEKQREQERYFK